MRRPRNRSAAVDQERIAHWLAEFAGYRDPVTNGTIELWLQQFLVADRDLAARVLDGVLFIGNQKIRTDYRELVKGLDGWDTSAAKRKGRWFFVPFSGSVGESGNSMVHTLRMAMTMTNKKYDYLFIHRSELVAKKPGPDDTVILVDDFSGTGTQACGSWEIFQQLLGGGPKIILMLGVATADALKVIGDKTEMEPICAVTLHKKDSIFKPECVHFTQVEKNTILDYCRRANPRNPEGFLGAGLLVVLAHRTPNDTIPILHETNGAWRGLFPRNE